MCRIWMDKEKETPKVQSRTFITEYTILTLSFLKFFIHENKKL